MLTPRHIRISKPVRATETRKRVRVSSTSTARHGGNRALADFQVTPPLGKSMVEYETSEDSGALSRGEEFRGVSIAGHAENPLPSERMRPRGRRGEPEGKEGGRIEGAIGRRKRSGRDHRGCWRAKHHPKIRDKIDGLVTKDRLTLFWDSLLI